MERDEARRRLVVRRERVLKEAADRASRRTLFGRPMTVRALNEERGALFHEGVSDGSPLYVDIHGGGFCWGRVDDGDGFCHRIHERLGFATICLDYPLTPEASFPRPLEWVRAALGELRDRAPELRVDPSRIVVGGRSAGANLAASLCVLLAEQGEPLPVCQVLDHPYLDQCGTIHPAGRYDGPHSLSTELLDCLSSAYASESQRTTAVCSPVRASEGTLRMLPPAVIQVCEWDSLRQDGELYARRLARAGVEVVFHCYPGVYHGFTEFENPDMVPGQDWLIDGIAKVLAVPCGGAGGEGRKR